MVLGKNEIYELGKSYGQAMHENDADMDVKELSAEIAELSERLGTAQVVGKLTGDPHFQDGVLQGYYEEEILEDALNNKPWYTVS